MWHDSDRFLGSSSLLLHYEPFHMLCLFVTCHRGIVSQICLPQQHWSFSEWAFLQITFLFWISKLVFEQLGFPFIPITEWAIHQGWNSFPQMDFFCLFVVCPANWTDYANHFAIFRLSKFNYPWIIYFPLQIVFQSLVYTIPTCC